MRAARRAVKRAKIKCDRRAEPECNRPRPRLAVPLRRLKEEPMNRKPVGAAFVALVVSTALHSSALAQNEQFIPMLVYRTGAYAPNGIPFANGLADYYTLVNERDGGINGVKIVFEECDTGYATDRGV